MWQVLRVAVMALVGYYIYDTISSFIQHKRRVAAALAAQHPVTLTGSDPVGEPVSFRDHDGAQRTQRVGRGVIA